VELRLQERLRLSRPQPGAVAFHGNGPEMNSGGAYFMKRQPFALRREGIRSLRKLALGQPLGLARAVGAGPEHASQVSEHDVATVGAPDWTGTSAERQASHGVPLPFVDPDVRRGERQACPVR